MAEYVSKEAAYDYGTLFDWYISSVSEDDTPVWTDEHIEELLKDFLVIPKDTPKADVEPVKHGHWIVIETGFDEISECSLCGYATNKYGLNFCPDCGSKMDKS